MKKLINKTKSVSRIASWIMWTGSFFILPWVMLYYAFIGGFTPMAACLVAWGVSIIVINNRTEPQ